MSRYPHLDRLNIPHEIKHTDTLVKWLMKIAETKPFLDEYLGTPKEVSLLRKAKVRAVTYSNQIEGNNLNERDVTAVLMGKHVAGPEKDIKEVQNYYEALDYIDSLIESSRPIQIADMCDLQKLVTSGLIESKQCGKIRSIPVSIINEVTGEALDSCPEPHELRDLLSDLWKWLEDTRDLNPFSRAFAFHFIAVSIHPFADGNGRTVRLMQHLLLLLGGQTLARFVPSETAIMRSRDKYYSVIRLSNKLGSLHPILEFLAECFALSAEEIVEEGRNLLKISAAKTPENRRKKILSKARLQKEFSMQDVVSWLPSVARRTLERDVATLVDQGALIAKGEKKARVYSLK